MTYPSPACSLRAVVFDLDGLILNTEDVYELAGVELLGRRGKKMDSELRRSIIGRPAIESLRIMIEWHDLADTAEALASESEEIFETLLSDQLSIMPGLVELVNAIEDSEIRLAIATSGTRTYAADMLARCDLHDRFTPVLTADDVTCGKPAPEVYELAAARLQLTPSETMVLEDSGNGCRAGVAAGAYTIAVPNRHTADHDFSGTSFVAETLADPRIRAVLGLSES